MKKKHTIILAFIAMVFLVNSCKKDSVSTSIYATLTMNVNGVVFTSDKANALYSPTTNAFIFANEQESNRHTISVVSYLGYNINTDYSININTIAFGSISQAMFVRNGNALDMFSFPFRSEKGYLNYRVVKKHTINGVDKFDVNFNGVIYASETDSVVITNGSIRY